MTLTASFYPQTLNVSVSSNTLDVSTGNQIVRDSPFADMYRGAYTVTPGRETQTLYTSGLTMSDNITIDPIPSNYGRITWNGSFITVS